MGRKAGKREAGNGKRGAARRPAKAKKAAPAKARKAAPAKKRAWPKKPLQPTLGRWSDAPPRPALAKELSAQAGQGAALLLPPLELLRPAEVVKVLTAHADALRSGKVKLSPKARGERCLMMACLWGEQLRAELGWEWASVRWPGGSSIGLVSPDRSYAVFPLPYFTRIVTERGSDNTILLLFNMIAAGNLPASAPGKYVTLS